MKSLVLLKDILKYISITVLILVLIVIVWGGGFGANKNDILHNGNALIFAHRGVTINHVENTIGAFNHAQRLGFNALETDVNVTKDGELVIFHDHDCKRLLDVNKTINELSWDEIQQMQLYNNGYRTESQVISLSQFLHAQSDSLIIYLDMKKLSFEIADNLLSIIAQQDTQHKLIIADASILHLAYLKYKNPNIVVALEGFNKGKEWTYYIIPEKVKPDYYASNLGEVDDDHMDFLSKEDLLKRRIVYGVNEDNIHDIYRLGIENIIFDYNNTDIEVSDLQTNLTRLYENK